MTLRTIIDECKKKSTDPRFPGLGKDPRVGFLIGFLFGAIGVGLYLRSWVDGLLCFGACFVLGLLSDSWAMTFLGWVLSGCWVAMRISQSTQRYEAMQLTRQTPSRTMPESAATEPDASLQPREPAVAAGI